MLTKIFMVTFENIKQMPIKICFNGLKVIRRYSHDFPDTFSKICVYFVLISGISRTFDFLSVTKTRTTIKLCNRIAKQKCKKQRLLSKCLPILSLVKGQFPSARMSL